MEAQILQLSPHIVISMWPYQSWSLVYSPTYKDWTPLFLLVSAPPVGTYRTSFSPDDLVNGSLSRACGCMGSITKGFIERGTNSNGIVCPMESHASNSSAPSNPLMAGEGLPTGSSWVLVRLAVLSCCPLTAIWSDLSRVAISPTNLARTSCCSRVCCSMASHSNLFSSHIASISSRIDHVSDSGLCVSSKLQSSSKCTVVLPCQINWSNFIWDNDVVRNSCAKYRHPLGSRWLMISSASCAVIQQTSSMSCSDAAFKSKSGCNVAMIQHDVQPVKCENEKTKNCVHKKCTKSPMIFTVYTALTPKPKPSQPHWCRSSQSAYVLMPLPVTMATNNKVYMWQCVKIQIRAPVVHRSNVSYAHKMCRFTVSSSD